MEKRPIQPIMGKIYQPTYGDWIWQHAHLSPFNYIPKSYVEAYCREFTDNGEKENVTFDIDEIGIDAFYDRQAEDERNLRFGFYIDGRLVGLVRISKTITYQANGNIGYSIRPSERGRKYSILLLQCVSELCKNRIGMKYATACVDTRNVPSIRALKSAGYIETGRMFEWIPNPEPRKAIEFRTP